MRNKGFLGLTPEKISPMKMCLQVYSTGQGEGRGTHLSVFLFATEGDDEFGLPPQDIFDIKLLNHTNSAEHHMVTFNRCSSFLKHDYIIWKVESWPTCYGGVPRFLDLEHLKENSPFVIDDCLYFQVTQREST